FASLGARTLPLARLQHDHPQFRSRGRSTRQPAQPGLASASGAGARCAHGKPDELSECQRSLYLESPMNITHFRDTPNIVLDVSNPVAVPLGEPVAVASTTSVERSDGVETGVWECTPGRWRRQIVQQE